MLLTHVLLKQSAMETENTFYNDMHMAAITHIVLRCLDINDLSALHKFILGLIFKEQ